jgi:hypothetical protein
VKVVILDYKFYLYLPNIFQSRNSGRSGTRLDPVKTSHFVNFTARPCGTKELKLDSGEKLTIRNVIKTMVSSRIIKQYLSFCQETELEPASERSLYRIIKVCSASKQKSIQGLDYFSTERAQAFETLQNAVNTLEEGGAYSNWGKEVSKMLKETKRYLKTNYKSHVRQDERCVDHCSSFSLSDPQKAAFSQQCHHCHHKLCNLGADPYWFPPFYGNRSEFSE